MLPKIIKHLGKKFLTPFHKMFYICNREKFLPPTMVYGKYEDKQGNNVLRTRYSNTVIFYCPGNIEIEQNVFIWHYTILDGTKKILIEEGCQIGGWVGIFTHSAHIAIRLYGESYGFDSEDERKAYFAGEVSIGKYSFVGAKSIIMPGTKIGKGCLVTANSYVGGGEFPDFSIISGNPAVITGDTRKIDAAFLKKYPELREYYNQWTRK